MSGKMSNNKETKVKIIMVGDSGVGKSCLLKSFLGDDFDAGYNSTIGVDFEIKPVIMGNKLINLHIWDTAGQERFRTITTSYYRSSDAILLVFDVTDELSFTNVDMWLEDVRLYSREAVDIMLIGNKVDLTGERKVPYDRAKAYADKNNMQYVETSAKQMINVQKAFNRMTTLVVNRLEADADRRSERNGDRVQLRPRQRPSNKEPCAC